jgi:hypothetical protein
MRSTLSFSFAALLICALLPRPATASVTYLVTANTSSISGQGGYLDLQFEAGPSPTNLATASLASFAGNGTLRGSAALTGDVTGQLPGALTFDNQTVFNDYFQGITFGTTESFDVTLNGPTPVGGGESAFYVSFYASDQSTALLTVSTGGDAGQIVINPNGTTTPSTYAASVSAASALTITLVQPLNTVPEPSAFALLALGTAFAILRKQRAR